MSAAVIAAVAWPGTWARGKDSFPLSPYPMFSRPLANARVSVTYAIGLDADGSRYLIAPSYIANDEVLLAKVVLRRAMRSRRTQRDLCKQIAGRVARRHSGPLGSVVRIRIVTGTHDAIEYMTGRNTVGIERSRVTCTVRR